jgi:hypothetical protein
MILFNKKVAAISMALAALIAIPGAASADVATVEEEDVVDITDALPNPALLPRLVDAGLVNESLEQSIPDVLDAWPSISVGGCLLSADAPTASSNGLRVKAWGGYACGVKQAKISIVICIQIRSGDQWVIVEGSCRDRNAADEPTVVKRASGYCRPGTWKYRSIAAGEATGYNGSQNAAIRKSGPATINCRTFGL